jgi:hypothetical protein
MIAQIGRIPRDERNQLLSRSATGITGRERTDRRLGAADSRVGRVPDGAQIGLLWRRPRRCAADEQQPTPWEPAPAALNAVAGA